MSDVMLFGVLRMPYEMAMGSELSRRQFYARAQEAVDRLEAAERDSKRLDWLESQREAYGFENCHEGNRWVIDGPFATVRRAIDATQECE